MIKRKDSEINKRGFTLVELLVVIVILSILTLSGIVSFGKVQAGSRDQKRLSNATIISEALEKYYVKNGEYPSVSSIGDQPVATVKAKLAVNDTDVLVFPQASVGANSSITSDPNQASSDKVAYVATSTNTSEQDQCLTNLSGGCDQFKLAWIDENGQTQELQSRHSGRDTVLQPPSVPTVVGSLAGTSVRATVSNSTCAVGTIQYEIIINTTSADPDWSSVAWQASTTKDVTSPVDGTNYFMYAKARCIQGAIGVAEQQQVADDQYFYGSLSITASWSGSNAVATVSISGTCGAGTYRKYYISYTTDTTSAAGVTPTVALNWTTTPTYTLSNAAASNPRRFNFSGQAVCDTTSTQGVLSSGTPVTTNTDSLVSAPLPAAVSNTSSSTTTTWTWPNLPCPVGTTITYKGTWTGNYNAYPAMTSTIASGKATDTTSQGFIYGLKATASCGVPSAKILISTSNDSTYYNTISRVPFRTAKAGIRTYRPSGGAGSTIYALVRVDTLQPTSGNSYAPCPTGLGRVVGWQTSVNGASWSPGGNSAYSSNYNTTTQHDTGSTKNEQSWSYDSFKVFYYTSDLDSGDVFEARLLARCKRIISTTDNSVNTYSPAASDTYPYDDRIGNLAVTDGSNGKFHVLCDITGSAGQSLKRPIWCTSGSYKADGSANNEQCHTESPNDSINGTMIGCWSGIKSQDSYAWSFTDGPPPNVNDPSNAPSDGQSGYDAPDTWGKMK